jgi:dTDP-4-amino-4,6-dideoxygalactose transaminase
MMKRKILISLPFTGDEEWRATREPLSTGWLTQGPKVAAFEKAFAKRHQVKHALATTSCTTGLHLILASIGIGPGDEVIVPAFTWVATANAVLYCGATPVFADVDRTTNNIDPADVARKLTPRTRAVIAVHLFGLCADMKGLKKILPAEIKIIEDAACASGASHYGTPAGGLGDAAAFSFHPRKSITTGEGGMVTTNDDVLAETANMLRNHGADMSEEERHHGPRSYLLSEFNLLGFNYRMTDLQGAVGLVQLGKLDGFIAERQHWAEYYREQLADIPWLRMPQFPDNGTHAWQAFVTYVDPEKPPMPRNEIMEHLQTQGIATRPGTHAVHMLGYYRDRFGLKADDLPGARDCNDNTMAIPLHNRMTQEDYEYVIRNLHDISF